VLNSWGGGFRARVCLGSAKTAPSGIPDGCRKLSHVLNHFGVVAVAGAAFAGSAFAGSAFAGSAAGVGVAVIAGFAVAFFDFPVAVEGALAVFSLTAFVAGFSETTAVVFAVSGGAFTSAVAHFAGACFVSVLTVVVPLKQSAAAQRIVVQRAIGWNFIKPPWEKKW